MQRGDFYSLSGQQQGYRPVNTPSGPENRQHGYRPVGMPSGPEDRKIQEQQKLIQQQMAPQVTKVAPVQPHQKLNVISSRQAEAIRSGGDASNSGCPNPIIAKSAPKKVDPELIESFMMGNKNPVMALNEFCQKQRLTVKFQEDTATSWGTICNPKFASVAVVDGVRHKQGVGRTKKEAKNEAAKIALSTLLGLTPDDVQEQEMGTAVYDSFGRKVILLEEEPNNQAMAARPATEKSYSSSGHYQINYNTAPTITSEDAWNIAKPVNYAEYQVKMAQQAKDQAKGASKNELAKVPAKPPAAQSVPIRPATTPPRSAQPQPTQQPPALSFGRGVLNQAVINSCLPGSNQQARQPVPGAGHQIRYTDGQKQSPARMQATPMTGQVTGYQPQTTGYQPPQGISQPAPGSSSGQHLRGGCVPETSPLTVTGQDQQGYHPSLEADAFPKLTDSAKPEALSEKKSSQSTNSGSMTATHYKPFISESVYDPEEDLTGSPFPQYGVKKQSSAKLLSLPQSQTNALPRVTMTSSSSSPGVGPGQNQSFVPRPQAVPYPTSVANYHSNSQPGSPASQVTSSSTMVHRGPWSDPIPYPQCQQPQAPQPHPQSTPVTNTADLASGPTVADQITEIARTIPRVWAPFPGCNRIEARRSFAAILLQRGLQAKQECISLGTGIGAVTGNTISADGRVVLDNSGLTIARRGLQRYLYRELKNYYEGNRHVSIFTSQQSSRLLTLKDGVTLHLYLNAAPSGDGARFVRDCNPTISETDLYLMACGAHYPTQQTDTAQGKLTVVGQDGVPVVVEDLQPVESLEMAKKQNPFRVMSGSDKLLQWNILGLQGALLSLFMEPVYLETITLGSEYDHGHLARAMCCRVDDDLTESLPVGYSVHHPLIGRVSKTPVVEDDIKLGMSLNWSFADSQYEVVDVKRGKCTESSPFKSGATGASRVCKAAFYSRFKNACSMAQRYDLQQGSNYHQAKAMCTDYQRGKQVLAQHLRQKGYGSWQHVPADIAKFSK